MSKENGTVSKVDAEPTPSPDLLGDLLGPLAIEGPPSAAVVAEQNLVPGGDATPEAIGALALATVGEESNAVQVLQNIFLSVTYPSFSYLITRRHFSSVECSIKFSFRLK